MRDEPGGLKEIVMRIAFVSCLFTEMYPDQPVWDWIAAKQPDRLVLLGDSTYFDIDTDTHPEDMDDWTFAQHVYLRYASLILQPQFAALVAAMPAGTVDAIWDDHDFLWNDATGGDKNTRVMQGGKMRFATACLEAFRAALQLQLRAGSFPTAANAASLWNTKQPPLTAPSVQIDQDVWLHLSDGRTNRTSTFLIANSKRTIFGDTQKAAFTQAITNAPQDVHLWASGSTMAGYQKYALDIQWLMGLAANQRMLMLSGDIHRNALDAFANAPTQFPLHEATSSGAALKDAVVVGAVRQNYGLVDVGPQQIDINLFNRNTLEFTRTIDRQTWLP
jgi:alkaline phosphatase D